MKQKAHVDSIKKEMQASSKKNASSSQGSLFQRGDASDYSKTESVIPARCGLGRLDSGKIVNPGLRKVEPAGPGDDALEVVGPGQSMVVVVLYIEE